MSIAGIGVDIVEIGRIAGMVERHGDHFTGKVFTPAEIAYCNKAAVPAVHFAGRWAAKEAFYKALPLSCQPHSFWKSIEILPESDQRKPVVTVIDGRLQKKLDAEGISRVHITISHERTMCVANVILENRE